MDEAIAAFRTARPELLKFGREAANPKHTEESGSGRRNRKKRSFEEADIRNGDPSPRKTRAAAKRSPARGLETIVVDDSEEEATEPEESLDDGLAACPICQKRMPEERVFSHLDSHNEPSRGSAPTQSFGLGQTSNLPSRANTFEALPGLNYSMLNETALRRKIDALGIPTYGNKSVLQRRHTEWVNIWNANCDSIRPRSKRELLRDLDTWERSQNKPVLAPTAGSIMDKDFDQQAWASNHGSDYKDLIARARENAKRRKAEKEEEGEARTDGVGEEEPTKSDEVSGAGEATPSHAQERAPRIEADGVSGMEGAMPSAREEHVSRMETDE